MKHTLLFTLIFASIQLYAADFNFTLNGKNYKIIETKKSWVDAAAWAVQDGGHLVEINSATEQNGIANAIATSGISTTYTSVNDGGGVAYIWIGATDKNTEGVWLWDGDNDGLGTNFYTGQGAWGAGNGAAVNGLYNNWGGTNTGTNNEPDDYGSSQDAAGIALAPWPSAGAGNLAGEWNDIDKSNTLYFIVEYENIGFEDNQQNLTNPQLIINQDATGQIMIKSTQDIQKIEVFSMDGKRVFTANMINATSYSMAPFTSKGVYFFRSYFSNEIIRSKKVLIQ